MESHVYRCANCREVKFSERFPKGWWVMANGEVTCSTKCRDRAYFAREQERVQKAFAYLREQQRREELGMAPKPEVAA